MTAKETTKRNAKVVSKPKAESESDLETKYKEMEKRLAEEKAKNEKLLAEKEARDQKEKDEKQKKYVDDLMAETHKIIHSKIRKSYAKHTPEQRMCALIANEILSFNADEIKEEFGGTDSLSIGRIQGAAINNSNFVQESLVAHGYDLNEYIEKFGKAKEINQ
jgi:hypothetical protein